MIIFGTTGLTFSGESGVFFCPHCDAQQNYQRKSVRRFFTLYFIPLIPLDTMAEYVECSVCREQYEVGVLSCSAADIQAASQRQFFEDLKRAMVLMMIADGTVDDAEVETIQQIYAQLTGTPLTAAEIAHEVDLARRARTSTIDYLRHVSGTLSADGKDLMVRSLFLVASAAGQLQQQQQGQLEQLPAVLEMTQQRFREVVARASEEPHTALE